MGDSSSAAHRFSAWQQQEQHTEGWRPFFKPVRDTDKQTPALPRILFYQAALEDKMIYQAISCHDLIGPSRLKHPPAQQKVVFRIFRPQTATKNCL